MWTYEGSSVLVPLGREYEVQRSAADDDEYGDLCFENGVVFGYVDVKLEDWEKL
jgi:hypothetical protein